MSDESEPRVVTPPQYVRLGAVLIALETSKSLREATRAIHDIQTESFPEVARLRAEVERLTAIRCDKVDCVRIERDRVAALARAESAEAEVEKSRASLDLRDRAISTLHAEIETLHSEVERLTRERDAYKRAKQENDDRFMVERDDAVARAESAESRVAELEAGIRDILTYACPLGHDAGDALIEETCRALLSPKPAPLPDLTFDADDPLPDLTPDPKPEPKCGEGGAT